MVIIPWYQYEVSTVLFGFGIRIISARAVLDLPQQCGSTTARAAPMQALLIASARHEAGKVLSNGISVQEYVRVEPRRQLINPPRKPPPRLGLDAFVLERPCFTSTHTEHGWHGSMPSLHPCRSTRSLRSSQSQGAFQLQAFRSGLLKPASRDTLLDRTVSEFSDPHPSRQQARLARQSYAALGREWQDHVKGQHLLELHQAERMAWRSHLRSCHTAA